MDSALTFTQNFALTQGDTHRAERISQMLAKKGIDGKANPNSIDAVSKDFEAMFIGQLLKQMQNTVPVDPHFGGGKAEEIYRSLMMDAYAKRFADAGGIGISDSIKAQLLQAQEVVK